MKSNRIIWGLVSIFVLAAIAVTFGTRDSSSQQKSSEKKSDSEIEADYKAAFPVVEYAAERSLDTSRKAKSRKYDRIAVLDPTIADNSRDMSTLDWEVGLSPLPVDKSQVIVLGTIIEARAHLSDNKASVYSEFSIAVEKIFKNEDGQEIGTGDTLMAERRGGRVRFPNGFETWVFVAGQGMPSLQKKYLFFLSRDFPDLGTQKSDLHILTAYKLEDGRVVPMDSPGGGKHSIAKYYQSKSISTLLGDLEVRLSKAGDSTNRKEIR